MTHEDIIRMARSVRDGGHWNQLDLINFAHLIQQHLIEKGYRKCAEGQRTTQHCALLEQAVREEREACAKLCDSLQLPSGEFLENPVVAIRARTNP